MKLYNTELLGYIIEDEKMIAFTYDNIISFDMNDLSKPPIIIAWLGDIRYIAPSPDKKYIVACDSCGILYQISMNNEYLPKKIKLKNNPNAAFPYFISNKKAITADWKGNVFCVDFERRNAKKILSDKDIDYYALMPSVDDNVFILQGLKGDCDTFVKKCKIINNELNIIETDTFGETVLYNHQLYFKQNDFIYFIDKINNVFYLLSYNETTKKIVEHFPLHQLNELQKSMTYYVDLWFYQTYKYFVISLKNEVQIYNLQGKKIQNVTMKHKNEIVSFSFIYDGMIYIGSDFGLYEEKLNF